MSKEKLEVIEGNGIIDLKDKVNEFMETHKIKRTDFSREGTKFYCFITYEEEDLLQE
jgi:hypothetical protein